MNVVIIADSGNFSTAVSELVEIANKDFNFGQMPNFTIINVVEPSLVVDMTLSVSGRTYFRHILQERLEIARHDNDELHKLWASEDKSTTGIECKAVVGDFVEVALATAVEEKANLLMICNSQSAGRTKRLLKESPCSVVFGRAHAAAPEQVKKTA